MKKYEIYTDNTDISGKGYDYTRYGLSGTDIFHMYDMESDHVPTLEVSFDTLQDAKDEFEARFRGYATTSRGAGHDIDIRVAWIQETEYDEDGEEIYANYVDVFDVAPLPAHVEYEGGESRYSDKAVDYMLVKVNHDKGYLVELYAEADPVDGDETATFSDLKAEILRQAADHGIDPRGLEFDDIA